MPDGRLPRILETAETIASRDVDQGRVLLGIESAARVLDRTTNSRAFSYVELAAVFVAWVLWFHNPSDGRVLLIAVAPLVLRLLAGQMPVRRTFLGVPLVTFLLTALLGVWAAYDRAGTLVPGFGVWAFRHRIGSRAPFPQATPVGWQAFWGLVLATLVFYAIAKVDRETQHRWLLAGLSGLGAALAIWFAAANDWSASPAKLVVITRLGRAVQALLPVLPGRWLNTNILGGAIAVLFPQSLGLVYEAYGQGRKAQWAFVLWGLATGAIMAFGLILTTSRGAWVGVAGSLSLGVAWWLAGRLGSGERRLGAFLVLVSGAVLVGGGLVALLPSLRDLLQYVLPIANRTGIFAEALLLVRDYFFTGFGPGEFALIHATYALLLHVPILQYAHSLFLDVALAQGVFGILSMVGVIGGAAWLGLKALVRADRPPVALSSGMLSLVVMTIHGLVDDPLYISRWVPLLWVPAALVVAGWRAMPEEPPAASRSGKQRWLICGTASAVGLVLLCVLWRSIGAAWYANLGAVLQTKGELTYYDCENFNNPSLDEIRRREDLSRAEQLFTRALELDPGQGTARTRLAAIALSRGQYDDALVHVQMAYDAGHRDRVTKLLLGDALVATGDVAGGTEVVRGLEWAEARLDGQAWYRYWVSGDYSRAADAWRTVVALNPENKRAADRLAAAEQRAGNP